MFAAGETVLMTAARTGDVATIEALAAAGARPNATEQRSGQTALMLAAAENNGPAITALLKAGAERDAREATGEFTALAFAVRGGAVDATRALLEGGADANAPQPDGTSLLLLATLNANYEVGGVLLDYRRGSERSRRGVGRHCTRSRSCAAGRAGSTYRAPSTTTSSRASSSWPRWSRTART